MMENGKLTYTVAELVHALGLGKSKIYQMLANGELPSFVLGGRALSPTMICGPTLLRSRALYRRSKRLEAGLRS